MMIEDYSGLLATLDALPEDRRAVLVVRSMPFGDIIESDTRKEHGCVKKIVGGPARTIGSIDYAEGNDWQFVAYGLCRAAAGETVWRDALRAAGYIR